MRIKYFCVLFFIFFIAWFELKLYLLKDFVVFLSVGQGDSALIRIDKKNVLIDAGPDWQVIKGLDKYLGFWNREIDAIIISHAHHDHFVGLGEIIQRYGVKKVYYYQHNRDDYVYSSLIDELKYSDISLIKISKDIEIVFNKDYRLRFLWPIEELIQDDGLNYLSIVNYLECEDIKILFSADINEAVEKLLITYYPDLDIEIFQSSHHGSLTGNSFEFLDRFKPAVSVVSVGKDNKHGLPNDLVIKRMDDLGIEIFRTDLFGDIFFPLKL